MLRPEDDLMFTSSRDIMGPADDLRDQEDTGRITPWISPTKRTEPSFTVQPTTQPHHAQTSNKEANMKSSASSQTQAQEILEWTMRWGSGTLRRAIEEDFHYRELYLHERSAMEIANGAMLVPESKVTLGRLMAFGDDKVTTESSWFARCLRYRWASSNSWLARAKVTVVYATVSCDSTKKMCALRITADEYPIWIPSGRMIIVPIAEEKENGTWDPVENPL